MIHMKNTTIMVALTNTRIAAALMLALVANSRSPASAPLVRPTHSWVGKNGQTQKARGEERRLMGRIEHDRVPSACRWHRRRRRNTLHTGVHVISSVRALRGSIDQLRKNTDIEVISPDFGSLRAILPRCGCSLAKYVRSEVQNKRASECVYVHEGQPRGAHSRTSLMPSQLGGAWLSSPHRISIKRN